MAEDGSGRKPRERKSTVQLRQLVWPTAENQRAEFDSVEALQNLDHTSEDVEVPAFRVEPPSTTSYEGLSEHRHKRQLVLIGSLLVVASIYSYIATPEPTQTAATEVIPEQIIREALDKHGQYPNPSLSLYDRMFCTGNQTSLSCDRIRPFHPFVILAENYGLTYEEWRAAYADTYENNEYEIPDVERRPVRRSNHNRVTGR